MTGGRLLGALLLGAVSQAPAFSFDGISLSSDFTQVAARFTHSTPQSEYISLAPADIHDHISQIEVSGQGPTRRVRIAFETRDSAGRAEYPGCTSVEAGLTTRYGKPSEIRKWMEEASPRADRVWRSEREELMLLCFSERGRLWAEAVQITPR